MKRCQAALVQRDEIFFNNAKLILLDLFLLLLLYLPRCYSGLANAVAGVSAVIAVQTRDRFANECIVGGDKITATISGKFER